MEKKEQQAEAAAQQNCAVCGKAITKTPIKRMGNFHCSVYCAERDASAWKTWTWRK